MSQIRSQFYSALTEQVEGNSSVIARSKHCESFSKNSFELADYLFLQIKSGPDKLMTNDDTNGADISEYKCLFGRFLRPRNSLGICRVSKQVSPLAPSALPPSLRLILDSVHWCQSGLNHSSNIFRCNNHWQWVCECLCRVSHWHPAVKIMTPR